MDRPNQFAKKARHRKLLSRQTTVQNFQKKHSFGFVLSVLKVGITSLKQLSEHTGARRKLIALTLSILIFGSSVFPTYFSINSVLAFSEGDNMVIPIEDDSIDGLLKNTHAVVDDSGVLNNPIMPTSGIGSGNIFEYEVSPGDTVSSIAEEFGISVQTILGANNLDDSDYINIGQTLKILPVDGVLYTAHRDTTIAEVAKQYGVDAKLIADQNSLTEEATIKKDNMLVIPGIEEQIADQTSSSKENNITKPAIETERPNAPVKNETKEGQKKVIKPIATPTKRKDIPTVITKQGSRMVWPTSSPVITTKFSGGHPGLDICYTQGDHTTAIVAALGGTVIQAQGGWNGGYGNMVVIDHGNGVQTRYGHMKEFYVQVGQSVKTGQTIGWMGNTGNVRGRTGLHLHFEVIVNKRRTNPYAYL